MKFFIPACVTITLLCPRANGQDYFPETIPTRSLSIGIEDFATLPDFLPGRPARVSLLTTDPMGRLFANDQRGALYTLNPSGTEVTEFLDLRDFPALQLSRNNPETGFQSFAFHPDFATADAAGFGRFYTIHSSNDRNPTPDFDPGGDSSIHTSLLEWRTGSPTAQTFSPANEEQPFREILRFDQPFGNHNAGLIAFNNSVTEDKSDYGNLYVAIGDGGFGGDPQDNGQDVRNPYGAILRINPLGSDGVNGRYGIVPENALAADGDDDSLGEIFAYGLRNPQRFGWDTETGNMFIADIGQNAVEEINLGANGANYGWNDREGSVRFDGPNTDAFVGPVTEYDHTNIVSDPPTDIGNRAVTVGEVVRNTDLVGLNGQLLLSDFPTGLIFTLDVDTDPLDGGQDGLWELQPLDADRNPVRLLELINRSRSERGLATVSRADLRFSINTPGDVYVTNKQDGVIRRLVPSSVQGDFNHDGLLDADDINMLVSESASGLNNEAFDLDGDKMVNQADVNVWVRDLKHTWLGDANLDGEFNSSDLTAIFQSARFETGEPADWTEGDWTGDMRFDTSDLIAAFQDAGYETGPRAIAVVPEPSHLAAIGMAILALLARQSRTFVLRTTTAPVFPTQAISFPPDEDC